MTLEFLTSKQWMEKLTELKTKLETACPNVQVVEIGCILDLRCDCVRGSVGIDFVRSPFVSDYDVMKSRVMLTNVDELRGEFNSSKVAAFNLLVEALTVCDEFVRDIYVKLKE